MYGIVGCVITLSGQMTGVGGQSIANVKKKLYLCSRVRQSGRTNDAHVIKATDASALPAANTPLVYVGNPTMNNTHVSVTFGMRTRCE